MDKQRFSHSEKLALFFVIAIGLFLRWYLLDERALHHDESLHGIYGKYFYINPDQKFYRYNPLLHGPFLYNILPVIYKFLGVSKFSIRFISCFLGSIFIFAPLLFKRFFTKITLLILISYISFSPSLVYWSRYIRHDYLALFFMLMAVIGVTLSKKQLRPLIILPAFALQLCVKENFFITIALITGFLLYDYLLSQIIEQKERSQFFIILSYPQRFPIHFIAGLIIAILCYVYFFSSGFRYSSGLLDGIYRKSLSYWIHQHSIERIKGPFSYQTLILGWYESLFLIATLAHIILFYIKKGWGYRIPIISTLITAISCHLIFKNSNLSEYMFWDFFKLKINLDFYPLFLIPMHALLVTTYYLLKKQTMLAFWGYFFFASFFSYSFVGEKVPWLSLYPMTAGLIFLSLYFQTQKFPFNLEKNRYYFPTLITIVVLFAFIFRSSVLTNFTNSGQPEELISQVHTELKFEKLILDIRKKLIKSDKKFYCHNIAIWPTSWFLYGSRNYFYGSRPKEIDKFDYIIGESSDYELNLQLLQSHKITKIPFRSWWVPNYKKMSWKNFFSYAFTHEPWNSTGTLRVTFYSKKFTRDQPSVHQ